MSAQLLPRKKDDEEMVESRGSGPAPRFALAGVRAAGSRRRESRRWAAREGGLGREPGGLPLFYLAERANPYPFTRFGVSLRRQAHYLSRRCGGDPGRNSPQE